MRCPYGCARHALCIASGRSGFKEFNQGDDGKAQAGEKNSVYTEPAGYQIRIGSLRPDLKVPDQVTLPSERYVRLEPLIKRGRRVGVADYDACRVILNNDLISGIPEQSHVRQAS